MVNRLSIRSFLLCSYTKLENSKFDPRKLVLLENAAKMLNHSGSDKNYRLYFEVIDYLINSHTPILAIGLTECLKGAELPDGRKVFYAYTSMEQVPEDERKLVITVDFADLVDIIFNQYKNGVLYINAQSTEGCQCSVQREAILCIQELYETMEKEFHNHEHFFVLEDTRRHPGQAQYEDTIDLSRRFRELRNTMTTEESILRIKEELHQRNIEGIGLLHIIIRGRNIEIPILIQLIALITEEFDVRREAGLQQRSFAVQADKTVWETIELLSLKEG